MTMTHVNPRPGTFVRLRWLPVYAPPLDEYYDGERLVTRGLPAPEDYFGVVCSCPGLELPEGYVLVSPTHAYYDDSLVYHCTDVEAVLDAQDLADLEEEHFAALRALERVTTGSGTSSAATTAATSCATCTPAGWSHSSRSSCPTSTRSRPCSRCTGPSARRRRSEEDRP